MPGCLWRNDRRRFPWIFDKTRSFASAIGAVSIEIRSKRIVIFYTLKPERKFSKQNKNKQQITRTVWRKLLFKPGVKNHNYKTRWHPVAERLNVTEFTFLQSNENPKYQSVRWLVWATTALKVPRLKKKLIKSSAFRGIPQKSRLKTSRHPGFRSWSAEQTATLSGKNSPRVW